MHLGPDLARAVEGDNMSRWQGLRRAPSCPNNPRLWESHMVADPEQLGGQNILGLIITVAQIHNKKSSSLKKPAAFIAWRLWTMRMLSECEFSTALRGKGLFSKFSKFFHVLDAELAPGPTPQALEVCGDFCSCSAACLALKKGCGRRSMYPPRCVHAVSLHLCI